MSEQLRQLLFPSRFFAWADSTQTTFTLETATNLIEEGQEGAELLLLVQGRGVVSTQRDDGKAVQLSELEAGQILGDMSFLEGRPTVATVVGQAGSRWIRIPFTALESAIAADLDLAADFYAVLARKLALQLQDQNALVHRWESSEIEPLRKVLLVFGELEDLDIDWLSRTGQVLHCHRGDVLIQQGSQLDQLWVVLEGDADVFLKAAEQPQQVGSSRRGELLGEMALLSNDNQATASVVASNRMQLLAVPQNRLKERMSSDAAFSTRFHRAMAMLLSHRGRDQLMNHGLASQAAANEALSLDTLDNISQAGRRFDWLCRQVATQ